MAFSDLQIKLASEKAVIAAERYVAPIRVFTTDFSPNKAEKFGAVAIPLFGTEATDFNSVSANYCDGTVPDGSVIQLNKYKIAKFSLTDLQNSETDINFLVNGTTAIVRALAKEVEETVINTIASQATGDAGALDTTDPMAAVANLHIQCSQDGVDPYSSVLVLNSATYAAVLAKAPYSFLGDGDAARYGLLGPLFGFKNVIQATRLTGVQGLIVPEDAVGVVNRVVQPLDNGVVQSWTVTDDKSGLSFGMRATPSVCSGTLTVSGTALFGVKVVQPAKVLKISE